MKRINSLRFPCVIGCLVGLLLLLLAAPCSAQPRKYYKLERGTPRQFELLYLLDIKSPKVTVSSWVFVAPALPVLTFQTNVGTALEPFGGQFMLEASHLRRPMIGLLLPVENNKALQHAAKLRLRYRATLHPCKLQVVKEPPAPVPPLAKAERERWLRADVRCIFSATDFRAFLKKHNLAIGKKSEIDFAFQVLAAMRKEFTYQSFTDMPFTFSNLSKNKKFDCGGASAMFTWIMRANGVPTRTLIGRYAYSGPNGEGGHAKAEFFATGVGWVPVEAAAPIDDKETELAAFIGQEPGTFLTMHVDFDLVVDLFGRKDIHGLQGISYWIMGAGEGEATDVERWKCTPLFAGQAPPLVSLESYKFKKKYMSHLDGLGRLSPVKTKSERQLATLYLAPGLADANLLSFLPHNQFGFFRHQDGRIRVHEDDWSDLFRKDATFRRVPGLADKSWLTFESLNFPGAYLRQRNNELWVEKSDGTRRFAEDATFRIVDPLFVP